ncbi:hypothetical protein ACT3CE_16710 [Marinifilum sp. RC60d5]|uniref:hypothetical protein n=1 Tax=Marinifilum sp. RC60d5 TaxID=3458414 RepID=UPI00403676E4
MNTKLYHISLRFVKSSILILFLILPFYGFTDELKNEEKEFDLHSITFVQKQIDVSKSDETLYFSLRAHSAIGLNNVIVFFESPSGKEIRQTSCKCRKKTKVGLLLGRILFKKKSESGEWKINKIVIEDQNGNHKTYNREFLVRNKFAHSFQIKNSRN